MRSIRIYQTGLYQPGETVQLSDEASQHVAVVLRMQPGHQITLFRGDNYEFPASILTIHKRHVIVQINTAIIVNRESSQTIHLAQAISKGDRMEWVIQKAVELGVTSITPLITKRCVVRIDMDRMKKKQNQWQAMVISACEQSGRNVIPTVHAACSLDSYLTTCHAVLKYVLHPHTKNSWHDIKSMTGDIALIVGPEGGLTEEEIARTCDLHFHPLTLGPRILRTETAAIAALTILQTMYGDLLA